LPSTQVSIIHKEVSIDQFAAHAYFCCRIRTQCSKAHTLHLNKNQYRRLLSFFVDGGGHGFEEREEKPPYLRHAFFGIIHGTDLKHLQKEHMETLE